MAATDHESDRATRAYHILRTAILREDHSLISNISLEAYTSTKTAVTITLGAVGSFALGAWNSSSPIYISCAGTPTTSTFFSFARRNLRLSSPITILHSAASEFEMFRVSINGLQFGLAYHQVSASLIPALWQLDSVPRDVLPAAKRHFEARAKTLSMLGMFAGQDGEKARGLAKRMEEWVRDRGLWGREFGYLNESSGVALSAIVVSRIKAISDEKWETAGMREFLDGLEAVYAESEKEPECRDLPLIKGPRLRDSSAGQAILRELKHGAHRAEEEVDHFARFTESYDRFLRLDLSYWGLSSTKGGRFAKAVESVLAGYTKRLDIRLFPRLKMRVWPERMVTLSADAAEGQKLDAYYEAVYLVGVEIGEGVPVDVVSSIPGLLRDEIGRYESFDTSLMFVDARWEAKVDAKVWTRDRKDWGPVPEERKVGDEDEDEINISEEAEGSRTALPQKPKKQATKQVVSTEGEQPSRSPLRPALNVLHRIKSDHAIDSSDFIIGYLDRHLGVREMPVEKWILKEETAEDFIPQSRIRYFKRASDGVVVWDREQKLDLVFGSGRKT